MSIANNIKKYRVKKGFSQDKLAKLADVTHTTLVKLESGANDNPTIKTLLKITKALDIPLDTLVKG
jgi:putative transcriptional regulator